MFCSLQIQEQGTSCQRSLLTCPIYLSKVNRLTAFRVPWLYLWIYAKSSYIFTKVTIIWYSTKRRSVAESNGNERFWNSERDSTDKPYLSWRWMSLDVLYATELLLLMNLYQISCRNFSGYAKELTSHPKSPTMTKDVERMTLMNPMTTSMSITDETQEHAGGFFRDQ